MRLVTFANRDGAQRTGVMAGDDAVVDLNAADPAIPASMLALLAGGAAMLDRARRSAGSGQRTPLADVTLLAPVPRPGKVLAIGVNYRDHAEETGRELPAHPVVFAKMPTCIIGTGAPVRRPRVSTALDWEGELCAVIGRAGRHINAADAASHIAGYMAGNDVTVRDWQGHSPTWMMGKGFDTHGPTGPWIATSDEVDAANLDIRTYVNGVIKQDSNTSRLIFGIGAIIEYLSTAFTLEPGDVIFTGTPAGVGVSRKPPEFMKAGDTVRVEISGLGVLENPIVDEPTVP